MKAQPRADIQKKRRRISSGAIVRAALAAAVIGFFAIVRFANIPALEPVREALRTVFLYDAFGRTVGGSSFISA